MVSVISGAGLGLLNSSLNELGGRGPQGDAATGQGGERVYVNAANGNLVVQNRDETLIGTGVDTHIVRTYNQQGVIDGDNNDGFRIGLNRKLALNGAINYAGSYIIRTNADGSTSRYDFDNANPSDLKYVSTDGTGAHDVIRYSTTTYTYTWKDGNGAVSETYNAAGYLTSVADRDGNTTTYTYGVDGFLDYVTDASGQKTLLDYQWNGGQLELLKIQTESQGVTQTRAYYEYDGLNRLTKVSVDLSPEDNAKADGNVYETVYTYEGSTFDIASITQSDGTSLAITYVTINSTKHVKTITDGEGRTTKFDYIVANKTTHVTDSENNVTSYRYDAQNRLVEVLSPAVNGQRLVTQYEYDADDNLTKVIDPKGHAISFNYDQNGNLLKQQDVAGNTVNRTYDANNNLITETVYVVPDPDGEGSELPSDPLTTRYIYDAEGHLQLQISAEGRVTEFQYNGIGDRIATLKHAGFYDLSGLSEAAVPTVAQVLAWIDLQDKTQIERADTAYNFQSQVDTITTYSSTDSNGVGVVDGTESVTKFVYDTAGQLRQTIDPRGMASPTQGDFTASFVYDGLGRLTQTTDANNNVTNTVYDDAGQQIVTTAANGLITTQVFNDAGDLVSLIESGSSEGTLGQTNFLYDDSGRLRSTLDPTGVRTHVIYDDAGRQVASVDGTGTLTEIAYDANGQAVRVTTYATRIDATVLIDANGKVVDVPVEDLRPVSHADDRTTFNVYDDVGRLVFTVDAEGFVSERIYDGASRVTDTVRYGGAITLAPTAIPTVHDIRALLVQDAVTTETLSEQVGQLDQPYDYVESATSTTVTPVTENATIDGTQVYESVDPIQPYTLIESAYDIQTQPGSTESVVIDVTNGTSPGQSSIIKDYAWAKPQYGGNLYQVAGMSLDVGTANYDDTTPTSVMATIYNGDGSLYGVVETDVDVVYQYGFWPFDHSSSVPTYNWAGQVNLSLDTPLPDGTYTVDIEVRDDAQQFFAYGEFWDGLDGEWVRYTTVEITVGSGGALSSVTWPTSTQPVDASSVTFKYRAQGSGGAYTDVPVQISGANHLADIGTLPNGNYEYIIEYRNADGALLKDSSGVFNATAGVNSQVNATFTNTDKIAVLAAGTSISGYIDPLDVPSISYVSTTVFDSTGTQTVSTALTYPSLQPNYNGEINLSVGQALADGQYLVEVTVHYTNETTVVDPQFVYEIGQQNTSTIAGHLLSWSDSIFTLSYGDTAELQYRVAGSGSAFTTMAVDHVGSTYQVIPTDLLDDTSYEYSILYKDSDGGVLKSATGTFTADNQAAFNFNTTFNSETMTTSVVTGSSLENYLDPVEVDAIDYLEAKVYNSSSQLVRTEVTYPGAELGAGTSLNLSVGSVLANGAYSIEVTAYYKDGTSQVRPAFNYEIGQQTYTQKNSLRWDASNQPTNTTAYFEYATSASGPFTTLPVTVSASSFEVDLTGLATDSYVYNVEYRDNATQTAVTTGTGSFIVDGFPRRDGILVFNTTETIAEHRQSRNFYDAEGLLAGSLDADGFLTEFVYNGKGQLFEVIAYSTAAGSTVLQTGLLADIRTDITANVDYDAAKDIHSFNLYDGKGQLVGQVDGEGFLTESIYDIAGNLVQQARYYNPASSVSVASTVASVRPASHAQDQVTTFSYTALNQLEDRTDFEGTTTSFEYDEVGNLVKTTSGQGTASTARAMITQFDLQGRVTAELTPKGTDLLAIEEAGNNDPAVIESIWQAHSVKYAYDDTGRRISSTDQLGNTTLFYYDNSGRLRFAINALGEVTETHYNAFGEIDYTTQFADRISVAGLTGGLVTQTLLNAITANISTDDSTVVFDYNQRGLLASTTDAELAQTTQTYNAYGELATVTRPENAQSQNTVTYFDYNNRGLQTTLIDDFGGLNRSTVTSYDAFGRVKTSIDGNGNLREIGYDKLGRTLLIRDPLNRDIITTYDAFGRVITQTDARGEVTTYSYDSVDRSVTITTPEGVSTKTVRNRHGEQVSVVDGNGNETIFSYDLNGNLISVTDPLNNVTSTSYDNANRIDFVTDANGTITEFAYDSVNRMLSRTVDPNGLNLVTSYEYDAKGQTFKVTDAVNVVTETQYDKAGRVKAIIVDAAPGGLNLKTEFYYDERGQKIEVIEGAETSDAVSTQYFYDGLDRLKQQVADPSGLALVTEFVYDDNDNLILRTDPGDAETRFVYDEANQVKFTIDALGGVTENLYDLNGQVSQTIVYATSIVLSDLSAQPSVVEVQSLLTLNAGKDQSTRYFYDDDGRSKYTVDVLGGVIENIFDGNGNVTMRYAYANTLTDPASLLDTQAVTNALDGEENPAKDQSSATLYDAANRPVYTVDSLGFVTGIEYDKNGNVTKTTAYFNNSGLTPEQLQGSGALGTLVAALIPDIAKDRTKITLYEAANRPVFNLTFVGVATSGTENEAYVTELISDGLGRVSKTIEFQDKIVVPNNILSDANALATITSLLTTNLYISEVVYDSAGRISEVTDSKGKSETYTYDARGNKETYTNKAGNVWTYEYDNVNRLTKEITPEVHLSQVSNTQTGLAAQYGNYNYQQEVSKTALVTSFEYDAQGNVISRTETAENQAATNDTRTTRYVYDALGRQVMSYTLDEASVAADTEVVVVPVESSDFTAEADDPTGTGTDWHITGATSGAIAVSNAPMLQEFRPANVMFSLSATAATSINVKVYSKAGTLIGSQLNVDAQSSPNLNIALSGYDADIGYIEFENLNASLTTYVGHIEFTGESSALTKHVYGLSNYQLNWQEEGIKGSVTQVTYDRFGNAISQITPPGGRNWGTLGLSYQNNEVVSDPSLGLLNASEDYGVYSLSAYEVTDRVYDQKNQLRFEVDAEGYVIEYQYDAFGNQTDVIRYAERAGQLPTVRGAIYDSTGTMSATTWRVIVEGLDQGLSMADVSSAIQSSSLDRAITYNYNMLGQLESVEESEVIYFDAQTNTYGQASPLTTSIYNAFGELTTKAQAQSATPGDNINSFTYYDLMGRVKAQVDPMGFVTEFEYDAKGNVTIQHEYAKPLNPGTWDANSYPTPTTSSASDPDGADRETHFIYDELGRKTQEIVKNPEFYNADYSGSVTLTQGSGDLVTTYEYDDVGNVTKVTDADGNITRTYYDALGRVQAILEPERLVEQNLTGKIAPVTVSNLWLGANSVVSAYPQEFEVLNGVNGTFWTGSNEVQINWSDITDLGFGPVQVTLEYFKLKGDGVTPDTQPSYITKVLPEAGTSGTSITWDDEGAVASLGDSGGIHSISKIILKKIINGVYVDIFDVQGTGTSSDVVMRWAKPTNVNLQVKLEIAVASELPDESAWQEATVDTGKTGFYWTDLSSYAPDQYRYRISYTRLGETSPYIVGENDFQIVVGDSSQSANIVAIQNENYLDIGNFESASYQVPNDGFYFPAWTGVNSVDLSWDSLNGLGDGQVRILLDYTNRLANSVNGSTTIGNAVTDREFIFDGAEEGARLSWRDEYVQGNDLGGIHSIDRVKVYKQLTPGTWTLLYDVTQDQLPQRRLILRGATAGLTGINVNGTSYAATAIGAGNYEVDISGLATGNYNYSVEGATSLGGSFSIREGFTTPNITISERTSSFDIREYADNEYDAHDIQFIGTFQFGYAGTNTIDLQFSSLLELSSSTDVEIEIEYVKKAGAFGAEGSTVTRTFPSSGNNLGLSLKQDRAALSWYEESLDGNGIGVEGGIHHINRIIVRKDGAEIHNHSDDYYSFKMDVTGIDPLIQDLELRYRTVGSSGNYLTKALTRLDDGWFSASYDEIENGAYEVELWGDGVKISGPDPLSWNVLRGADSIPEITSITTSSVQTLAPLTSFNYNVYGDVVRQIRHGASATIDSLGNISNSETAENAISYTEYDVLSRVRTAWDAAGKSQVYRYDWGGSLVAEFGADELELDALGTQQVLAYKQYGQDFLDRNVAKLDENGTVWHSNYNAFGEITHSFRDTQGQFIPGGLAGPLGSSVDGTSAGVTFQMLYEGAANGGGNTAYAFDNEYAFGNSVYSEFDNVGRMWRSNEGNGADTIFLYDLLGRKSAEVTSAFLDLSDVMYTPSLIAQKIVAGDADIRVTQYQYDDLGRVIKEEKPEFNITDTSNGIGSNVVVGAHWMDIVSVISAEAQGFPPLYSGNNTVTLNWSSLAELGSGDVFVDITYVPKDNTGTPLSPQHRTQTFTAAQAETGVTLSWDANASGNIGIQSLTEVKLYKNIGGQMQLLQTVDATQGDSYTSSTLSWKALPVANLDVALQVAVKGTGNWNSLTPTLVGNRYVASLTSLAANQYEYQITYTRQGETEPLLSATGEFDVLISNVAGSSTLVNFVEDQDASASFTPAVFDFQSTMWQSDNVINLNWTSLMGYGGGNVYIEVDFQAKELQGSGTVPRTWSSGSVAWSNAMTGYQATISPVGEVYAIVDSITAVRIYKVMPNSQQQLIRQLSNPNTPKLMLTGNVTDLSSITIDGIGSRAAVNLGNGYYQVDLSGLANGTYTFTSNQTPALTGSFTVADSYNPGELRLSEPQGSTAVLGLIQPEISQHHDRWGNVLSLTDALGALTTYQYDYRNQLTQETKPEVTVYGENGVGVDKVTTTIYQYDALGRLLQVTDDRENQTSRKYDDAGQVVAEYQADGGVMTHEYDNMGRKVADTDANGHRTEYVYDMKDQLTDVIRTTGTTQYAYDAWGKRYKTTNALGETMYEVRSAEGRITQTYYADGRQVQVAYNKDDKKVQEISTAPNTTTITKEWLYDIHGNLLLEAVTGDFGAHLSGTHLTSYKYNSDGTVAEIKGETGSGTTTKHQVYTYYANGQVKSVTDIAEGGESLFTYDANGRQSYERTTKNNNVVQDTLVKYDDLGRVTFVQDNDFLMEYGYDENGNRRFVIGSYLDNNGNPTTVENWYTYDNENRILISQGERVEVSPGVFEIQATTNQGVQLSYDGQGNRRIAYFYDNNEWVTENYVYDESNRLIRTTRNGDLTSVRSYDAADRMTAYTSYSSPGVINESRTMEYDENGWLQTQKNYGSNGELKYTVSYTDYDVTGQVLQYRVNLEGVEHDQIYTYYYVLNASGVQTNTINGTWSEHNDPGTTTYEYDNNGFLKEVSDSLNNNNTRTFVTNANGQILTKLENGNTQRYFYVQGKTIASVNGTNGKADFDYNYTPVSDSYPASTPSAYVVSQGDTLQSIALAVYGDAQLWYLIADANGLQDNSSLELGKTLVIPNRITNIHNTADTFKPYNPASIIGDTTPTLPDPPPVAGSAGGCGIVGTIIMIVVAVVATIITAGAAFAAISGFSFSGGALFTAGAAVLGGAGGAAGLAAAAIGGAVGSIASQLVGMALGVQEDFSWSGVAAGAIGSAFTAGIGAAAKGTFLAKEGFANGLARGAINNVASQGAQMLTGGDKNFNWASFAANSIASGLTNTRAFRSKFGTIEGPDGELVKGTFADSPLLSRLAQGVVYQGTQSAVNKLSGESGKVDWVSMAADSFGNVLAEGIVEGIKFNSALKEVSRSSPKLAGFFNEFIEEGGDADSFLSIIKNEKSREALEGLVDSNAIVERALDDDVSLSELWHKDLKDAGISTGNILNIDGEKISQIKKDTFGMDVLRKANNLQRGISELTDGVPVEDIVRITKVALFGPAAVAVEFLAEKAIEHVAGDFIAGGLDKVNTALVAGAFETDRDTVEIFVQGHEKFVTQSDVLREKLNSSDGDFETYRDWVAARENVSQSQEISDAKGGAGAISVVALTIIGGAGAGKKALASRGGGLGFSTTTASMRNAVKGKPYIDPLTNKLVTPGKGVRMAPDHLYPVSKIRELPGFDQLTKAQQKAIIHDTKNIQPLPKSFNESKGGRIGADWKAYKGEPLSKDYIKNLEVQQNAAKIRIQKQINEFFRQNSG